MINDGPPVTPRPSATVLLLRDGDRWEVLMLRRPGGSDFAPGAWVFPGGSVHAEDSGFADPLRAAALRELFEEAGVLLGRSAEGAPSSDQLSALRDLAAKGRAFPEALRALGLVLEPERLTLFARWITPELIRRRFDTCFYLARMPDGQEIHPQPGEIEDWRWFNPARVLEDDSITLVFATRKILESIAADPGPEQLLARFESAGDPAPVMPRIVQGESGWQIEL